MTALQITSTKLVHVLNIYKGGSGSSSMKSKLDKSHKVASTTSILCHYFMDENRNLIGLCDNDGTKTKQPKFRNDLGVFMCEHHYLRINPGWKD